MDITLNRAEFVSAMKNAAGIAPASSVLDVLTYAKLSAEDGKLTVTVTSLELTLEQRIPADIREDGEVLLPAKLLSELLRAMSEDSVTLKTTSEHQARLSSGLTIYDLLLREITEFPTLELPFPEDTVPVTGIPAMAKRTVFATSDDPNEKMPMKRCVRLAFTSDGLQAASTDGFRIASAKGDEKSVGSTELLLPAHALQKLSQLVSNRDELRVGRAEKSVTFFREDFVFTARLMEGKFVDTDRLLSTLTSRFTVLTDAATLRELMETVTTVQGRQNRLSLRFEGQVIEFSCESEYGVSTASAEGIPLRGEPIGTYWFNPHHLADCLRAQDGTLMLEVAANGALLLKSDALTCVQLPIREPKPIDRTAQEPKKPKEPKKSKETKKKQPPEELAPAA